MTVAGSWKGEYSYDENAEAPRLAGQVVGFTVELKQGWLGMISGTIQDDPRTGIPEAGTVRGRVKGTTMQFTKQLPVLRLIHETSALSLEKWAERHKVVMDTEKAHPPIRHQGEISDDGQEVRGTWLLTGVTVEVPGSYQPVKIPTLTGAWHMKRVAANQPQKGVSDADG